MDENSEIVPVQLTDKEMIFAEAYLVCLNKAEAARQAGCPAKAAKEQGYEMYNRPHVKAYITEKLKERVSSAEEVVKMISDTAGSSLTDYYVPVQVVKYRKKKIGLQLIIDKKQAEFDFEDKFALRVNLTGDELSDHVRSQKHRKREIIRLKLELEDNPKATRIIDIEELVTEMQLDINKLVADKERGKVKKIKYGMAGLEVEMLDQAAARESLMKMHGQFEKDNAQKAPIMPEVMTVKIVPPPEDDDE